MKVLFLFIVLSLPVHANDCVKDNTEDCGHRFSRKHAKYLQKLNDLTIQTDKTLDAIIRVAVVNMRALPNDFAWADADEIEYRWNTEFKGLLLHEDRDIGHIYLIKWLEASYDSMERALGVEVCKALHLSDIKTVNCFLGIVGHLCTYDMTGVLESRKSDVRDHLAKGAVYYGIGPVVTYWAVTIGCWSGTSGAGAFLCAIAASGAEFVMGNFIMPPISDRIFDAVCPND